MKVFLIQLSILLIIASSTIFSQDSYNKIGGVCFRVDDSVLDPSQRLIPYINVFNARGLKFTYAVNFGYNFTPDLVTTLHQMQNDGFEIADHTPNHETRFFDIPLSDVTIYQGLSGVDHIIINASDARVCLEWDHVKTDTYTGEGLISISGNTVTSSRGYEFTTIMQLPSTLDEYSMDAIYIPSINKIFKFDPSNVTRNKITNLKSFWGEDNVNLTLNNIEYHKLKVFDVFYAVNAFRVLSGRTQKVCSDSGLIFPTTWIQPGGTFPQFYRADIKDALSTLGYTSAGNFADPVPYKVYNSYDPNDDNRYGMTWEDFNEETQTLSECKKIIADNFARHYLSIGQSHLLNGSSQQNFNTYLQRTANILDWCIANDIPVRTYSEWAQQVYETPQNPYVNVMPSIDVDLDGDNNPDGFYYHSAISTDGVPGIFDKSFSTSGNNQLCSIWDLGGVEKGENYFGIWIKGVCEIEVHFVSNVDPYVEDVYTFYSNSTNWAKYNCTFQIPDTTSAFKLIQIFSVYTSGTIKIGGLELKKNSPNNTLKVFLEGPYNSPTMNTTLNSQGVIPLSQPYSTEPWMYSGAENLSSIASDIVDWILLDLRTGIDASTIVGQRAAFLKSDGNIVDLDGTSAVSFIGIPDGSYYLAVHHRNHLSILSASSLPLLNGNIVTNYDFTTGQNKAYGTNPMKDLGGGSYGMYAGDADGDGTINATGLNSYWIPQNGTTYDYFTKTADFNLDGSINATDLNDFWIPNNGISTQVP